MTRSRSDRTGQHSDFEFAALCEARNYREALVADFRPWLQGRVLEVGAGIGQITELLCRQPAISEITSIEPNPAFCAQLRRSIPGHRVVEGTIEQLSLGQGWDALVSINVLEHIEDDVRELDRYRRALAQTRGVLCLFVPARPEIYAPIDRDFGHFRRYTRDALQSRLLGSGFRIELLVYFNCIGYIAWWLTFCVLRRRTFDRMSVRWFDRYVFPLMHAFEWQVAHPPVGQSLMAVARAG